MPSGRPTDGVSDGSRRERGGDGGMASRGFCWDGCSFSRSALALAAAHLGRDED